MAAHVNRIEAAITALAPRLTALDTGKRDRMESATELSLEEGFCYQETKSWAQVSGLITVDEALTVYQAMNGATWAPNTPLATKIVIMQLMTELLAAKLARKHCA